MIYLVKSAVLLFSLWVTTVHCQDSTKTPFPWREAVSSKSGFESKPLDRIISHYVAVARKVKVVKVKIHNVIRKLNVSVEDPKVKYEKMPIKENTYDCHLHPVSLSKNMSVYSKIMHLVDDGVKLITFKVKFPEYESNPLTDIVKPDYYKPNVWFRTYDYHAKTLFSLPFNYKIASMYTLWFGTAEVEANVVDYPKGCFAKLDFEEKIHATLDIVSNDFKDGHNKSKMHGLDPHVCYQVIKTENGSGHFAHWCCRHNDDNLMLECALYEQAKWIFYLLCVIKTLAFLFGPLVVSKMFCPAELDVKPYEVELDTPINGTLTVDDANNNANVSNGCKQQPQAAPRKIYILITKLVLMVDHRYLMTATEIPIGFFQFIYHEIFRCRMNKSEPFRSCFKSEICPSKCCSSGQSQDSESQDNQSQDNDNTPPTGTNWGQPMKVLGMILMIICIPMPLYIRLFIFYGLELAELEKRNTALKILNVSMEPQDLFRRFTPHHPFLFVLYSVIIFCSICLQLLRQKHKWEFDSHMFSVIKEMKNVKIFERLRMGCAYLILPCEMLGIWGVCVTPVYWTAMILITLPIIILYYIPTIYLVIRFLLPETQRDLLWSWLKKWKFDWGSKSRMIKNSKEACKSNQIELRFKSEPSCIEGIMCVLLLLSSFLLFGEVVGFYVECLVFTLIGAIVNFNTAGKYMMVPLTLMLFCITTFRNFNRSYQRLSKSIFELLNGKFDDKIKKITDKAHENQTDVALRYWNDKEIHQLGVSDISGKFMEFQNHLIWKCKGLVLFVDADDTIRIPKKLFRSACEISLPGFPGKVVVNLLKSLREIVLVMLFLAFIWWVVTMFHHVYTLSTTQQMLLTLSGTLLPFIIQVLAHAKSSKEDHFNNYAFQGSMNEVVMKKTEKFRVCGFKYRRLSQNSDMTSTRFNVAIKKEPHSPQNTETFANMSENASNSTALLKQNPTETNGQQNLTEANCYYMSLKISQDSSKIISQGTNVKYGTNTNIDLGLTEISITQDDSEVCYGEPFLSKSYYAFFNYL